MSSVHRSEEGEHNERHEKTQVQTLQATQLSSEKATDAIWLEIVGPGLVALSGTRCDCDLLHGPVARADRSMN